MHIIATFNFFFIIVVVCLQQKKTSIFAFMALLSLWNAFVKKWQIFGRHLMQQGMPIFTYFAGTKKPLTYFCILV